MFLARHTQLQKLGALRRPDFADSAVGVDCAAGGLLQVVAVLDRDLLAPHASGGLDVQGDLGGDVAASVANRDQAHIGPIVRVLHRGRGDLYLLDQPPLVGIDRVQPVDHVVLIHVGGRVAQCTERVHGTEGLLASPLQAAVHTLRLVHNDDGPGGCDQVDGLFATGLFAVLVEVVDVLLVDGTHGYDHDLDLRAGGEVAHLTELPRVVEEVVEGHAGVEPLEVVLGDLERLVDALLDGNGRHHDHELGEAVALVQLKDGSQVDVGLAGSRLHLDGEVT